MKTRRDFLKIASLAAVGLAAPLSPRNAAPAFACQDDGLARCDGVIDGPDGALPGFDPWWVQVHLPTLAWRTARDVDNPLGKIESGQYFLVQAPQDGPRLWAWDPRQNLRLWIGAEAVGPVGAPYWAEYLNGQDGRWISVSLRYPSAATAMQADLPQRRALVITGMRGYETKPGYYSINRRVYNETMDSRTIPGMTIRYRYENVLYTQYFTWDGAAIHYNYWAGSFGSPGSRGCLGMTLDDSKFFWEWADIGVPLVVSA